MTRLEKIQMAIDKGITCDINTGKIYNKFGKELVSKRSDGYKYLTVDKTHKLYQHHFIYYISTNLIVDEIDHINNCKDDNRICNLRSVSRQENQHNKKSTKGYHYVEKSNKWTAAITLNSKRIYLGTYDSESDAHQAYLDAKKIYHKL